MLQLLLFLVESEIAGMAVFLTIDHALGATLYAGLVVIHGGVQRLGLLQAFAANGCLQRIT